MPGLSTQAKEATKVGLAMTAAYAIGLGLDWANPVWVATSVGFVSLPSAGQSLSKAALRMGGTLIAMAAGLFYLGLFPQDRWLFFAAYTPYLAFVTYKMTGRDGQYLWFVAGFASLIIMTAGPGSSEHAFQYAVDRGLETLIGISLWSLVAIFIWPQSSLGPLQDTGCKLLATLGQLVGGVRGAIAGADSAELAALRASASKLEMALRATIGAAASERYEVREVRHLWEGLHASAVATIGLLDRLRADVEDLRGAGVSSALPGVPAFLEEVEARLEEAGRVLGGADPAREPSAVELAGDGAAPPLDHFRRAAVEVARSELEALDAASREALGCVRALCDRGDAGEGAARRPPTVSLRGPLGLPPLDPDRVRATAVVVAALWVSALAWIYLDPPGHLTWLMFTPTMAMVAAQAPFVRFALLRPMTYAYLAALVVYVFVMPRLSQFWELGLVIFTFTWIASYFFAGPARLALYLSMFLMLGVQNQQTYDFASHANKLLFTVLALASVVALSYLLGSPRPEKRFLALVRRFFASSEVLVAWAADPAAHRSTLERARGAYHLQELRTLPGKLRQWGSQIDHRLFPRNGAADVEGIAASLQVLAHRVEDLIDARLAPQAEHIVRELRDDVRAWRVVVEQHFGRWAEQPEADPAGALRERLTARIQALEARVEEAMNAAGPGDVSAAEGARLYRVLGALRALSEAAIAYAACAGEVDWEHWREERFS